MSEGIVMVKMKNLCRLLQPFMLSQSIYQCQPSRYTTNDDQLETYLEVEEQVPQYH